MGKNQPTLAPVTITIRGHHDSGRTTLANLIKMSLEENGYAHVSVEDTKPLPQEEKDRFPNRFDRNRNLRAVARGSRISRTTGGATRRKTSACTTTS